jgi:hypothetical protein
MRPAEMRQARSWHRRSRYSSVKRNLSLLLVPSRLLSKKPGTRFGKCRNLGILSGRRLAPGPAPPALPRTGDHPVFERRHEGAKGQGRKKVDVDISSGCRAPLRVGRGRPRQQTRDAEILVDIRPADSQAAARLRPVGAFGRGGARRRGYQASGTAIVGPSARSTSSRSESKRTSATRSSRTLAEILMPGLQHRCCPYAASRTRAPASARRRWRPGA